MNRTDEKRFNENVAVYWAMLKAGFKRKPKLRPAERARRLAVEKILQQRRYCDAFALWRSCRQKACRRQQSCGGDAHLCLKRALVGVPRQVQWRVRQDVLDATPRNIGAPEREARGCMPLDFYE
jgi:hypothetical protein